MGDFYITDLNDIVRTEEELDKLMKDYKINLDKIKNCDGDYRVLRTSISEKKLRLQNKLDMLVEQNKNNMYEKI